MMAAQHVVKSKGGEGILGVKLSFVRDIATMRDTREGGFRKTENPLDMGIHGDGYFVIGTENGERYTRNGHFRLDEAGQLVTGLGDPVLSQDGEPFFFSPEDTQISLSRDGTLSTENGDLGRIRVVRFENDQELIPLSGGLYSSPTAAIDVEIPDVVQGMLEGSNVQAIVELTKMIKIQNSYNSISKMIERENDRIQRMTRELVA